MHSSGWGIRVADGADGASSLVAALLEEDRIIRAELLEQARLRRLVDDWLQPATELRTREQQALAGQLAAADGEAQLAERARRLETDLAAVRHDLDDLRQSRSWRWTGPLRLAYRWLRRIEGPHG